MDKLHFKVSSGLKNIIGQDLITEEFIAIYELVKNSFDAHATQVDILFTKDSIIIQDNGKGMSYDDIIEKWLFVAYSAKKAGKEDIVDEHSRDYRSELSATRYYAGAKGIGRFSCDRLGSTLHMYSAKSNALHVENIIINWSKFEENADIQFEDVEVVHKESSIVRVNKDAAIVNFNYGTILLVKNLRASWGHERMRLLKRALTKLINPFDENTNEEAGRGFKIFLHAPEFQEEDKKAKSIDEVINGEIKNSIIELVKFKSTAIHVRVANRKIHTILEDRGVLIYEIKEDNDEFTLLNDVDFYLYFINTAAKTNFTRRMGLQSTQFGSVFLFKNGFRVYPFGEPGDDMLGIDKRKQQGYNRFLGTRDLLGRIEIKGDPNGEYFKESSSRDGGLVDTVAYRQLVSAFIKTCLVPLEKYVSGILWYTDDINDPTRRERREMDRHTDEPYLLKAIDVKAEVADLLANLTRNKKNGVLINYDPRILQVSPEEATPEVKALIDRMYNFAEKVQDSSLIHNLSSTKKYIADLEQKILAESLLRKQEEDARRQAERDKRAAENAAREAEERASKAEERAKAEEMANTLLKSTIAPGLEQVVSLHHLIGISSGTIDTLLKTLQKASKGKESVSTELLVDIIDKISFENNKIHVVTQFATKANFLMNSEEIDADIARFLSDYLKNISSTVFLHQIKIEVVNEVRGLAQRSFKPIELSMVIDNLVSNSWKARANNIKVTLRKKADSLIVHFRDDGQGVQSKSIDNIFKMGYTTTRGSGLGLHHVKQILERMGADIYLETNYKEGAEFVLTF